MLFMRRLKCGTTRFADKPLIIARNPEESGGRGVVATANYMARQLGVHSAMSPVEAKN